MTTLGAMPYLISTERRRGDEVWVQWSVTPSAHASSDGSFDGVGSGGRGQCDGASGEEV